MSETSQRTIGILGGSFNPAHRGHLHLSHEAMKWLGLDEIWWLLSPHNPLKNKDSLADYEVRRDFARDFLKDEPKIHLSEFESEHGLQYSTQTLRTLKAEHPEHRFIWLMGADNLAGFHHWQEWQAMMKENRIAVFDRSPYQNDALAAPAAQEFSAYQLPEFQSETLQTLDSPAWCYIKMPLHPESSTNLRKTLGESAFLSDN